MLRRKLTGAIILAGALNATNLYALGLGEMTLHSALNQPLEAEIKLLNVGDLSSNQILVGLASRQDFENAGVERDFFLTNLKFDVVVDSNGNGFIKIKTHKLVNEPYLNFLVEARWPAGKLLREYTALLDLPIYTESADTTVNLGTTQAHKEKVEKPKTPAAQQTTLSQSQPTVQGKTSPASSSVQTHYQGDTYRIERNDTLWSIAKNVKPSDNVTIQQTIVALQQINPDAFVQNNINRMKAGHVLRIPDERQIQDIHAAHALREVAAQNREWRSSPETAQLDATVRSAPTEQPVSRQKGHLKLSSADTIAAAQTDAQGGGDAAAMQSGAADLEMLDKTRRENQELKQQSTQLQQRLEDLERLVQLKDEQLSALQGQALEASAETPIETVADSKETGSDTQPDATAAPVDSSGTAQQDTVVENAVTQDTVTIAESVKTEPVKAEQKPVAEEVKKPAATMQRSSAPEKSFVDQLLESPLYIGGALILLLLVLGGLFMKRRAQTDETESALFKDDDASLSDEFDDLDDQQDNIRGQADEDLQEQELENEDLDQYEEELAEAESGATKSETGDAIGEADIYVAYGRYQHAIDLLKNAIAGEPQRTDLRVKLLDVYLEAGERDGFKEQFVELQSLGNEQAVAKAKEMLSTVDGASDWLDDNWLDDIGAASSKSQAVEDEDDDLDFESEASTFDETDVDDTALELGELEFELDTDEPEDSGSIEYDLEGIDLGRREEEQESEQLSSTSEYEESEVADLEEEGFELDLLEEEPADDMLAFDEELDESLTAEDLSLDLAEELSAERELSLAEDDFELEDAELIETDELPEELTELDLNESSELDDLSLDEETELDENTRSEGDESGTEFDIDDELEFESFDADDLDAAADAEMAEEAKVGASAGTGVVGDAAGDAAGDASDEFDFLSDTDEVATKLDLARAYIDMGDIDGAKDILEEVLQEGSQEQKNEASQLIERIE